MCRLAKALSHHPRGIATGVGQQDQKLLPAKPEHHVHVAQLAFDRPGYGAQHAVARGMPMGVVDFLEVVDVQHQQRQRVQMPACHVDFSLQRLVHGHTVAGFGQRVTQGAAGGGAVEQGVAHRIKQGHQQEFELAQFFFKQPLVATKDQFPQVLAFMAQGVADGVMTPVAKLQAQVAGGVTVLQRVQRHQALNFTKEQAQDALRLQAGLQLLVQLLAKFGKGGGATWA